MRTKHLVVFAFALFLFGGGLRAQGGLKDMEEKAAYYFEGGEYEKAYFAYDLLNAKKPENLDYKFRLGYCCLNYPEKKIRAIEIFEDIQRLGKFDDIDYYLAKSYHINYRFEDAIKYYEAYLATKTGKVKEKDKPLVDDAELGLMNCKNGLKLVNNKITAPISNVGPPINSPETEGAPIITADESQLIFTYAGKKSMGGKLDNNLKPDDKDGVYHDDIFISVRSSDSTWSEPIGIASLNSNGNDGAVAISPDGQTLFTFGSDYENGGDLYMCTLNGSEWSKPIRLNKNINTNSWEGSCTVSADGKFLYFASERPDGGLGGRDIWVSEKKNGDWGPATNLGPKINTKYDEDAPFIHPDGITLFFSSKGHESIGGYDIMFSVKKDGEWIEPKSMGIPLNTTEDDRYYVINAKGDKGYFSSNRAGAGGTGGQDIYMVTPGVLGEKPIIALLKGTIYGSDKPIEGKIEVLKNVTNAQLTAAEAEEMAAAGIKGKGKVLIGPYYSNSATGKYLFALSPGFVYNIKVSAEGFDAVEEELDIESLVKYLEVKKDFYLYPPSANTVVATNTVVTTQTTVVTPTVSEGPCAAKEIPDLASIKGKSLNDAEVYKQMLNLVGDYCAEGLVFKVQIGAYRHPENYKYKGLESFGAPEVVAYPDGITRFTQLQFVTIKEAEVQRQKAIARGQKDAWIVAFVGGKRYTLEELIALDFLGKRVN